VPYWLHPPIVRTIRTPIGYCLDCMGEARLAGLMERPREPPGNGSGSRANDGNTFRVVPRGIDPLLILICDAEHTTASLKNSPLIRDGGEEQ